MDEPLRLVVMGVGRMGRIHAEQLADRPGISLVGVADAVPGTAAALADQLGIEPIDPVSLPAREDVEAWVVATPTTTHPDVVRSALSAGVHVLCEKPLALDLGVGSDLAMQARSVGRVLQIGFWRRFSPPWSTAKRLIDAGAIGRPLMLRLSQWDADPPPPSFCRPEVSGGLAIDCGVHEFDLAEWLTGASIERVRARNLPIVESEVGLAGDVDNLVAMLDLTGGAVATVDLSRNCRYGDDVRTEILGEGGAIMVDMLPHGRTRLATSSGVETVEGSVVDDPLVAGVLEQASVFARLARGEVIAHPDAAASDRALAVGRAIQTAAATDGAVDVAS
jgi:myo-inositol 2-dehydrogenase/D-chiro-inositol 1-dehydrogenase